MKVYFKRVFQLSDGYQENFIDKNNFKTAKYVTVPKTKQNLNGMIYDDIIVLEPKSYFEIEVREDTLSELNGFTMNTRMLEAGLILSGISNENHSIFVYNASSNYVYLESEANIGEIPDGC